MPDEFLSSRRPLAPRPAGVSLRAVMLSSLLAFGGGAVLVGWLVWDGRIALSGGAQPPAAATSRLAALPAPSGSPAAALQTTNGLEQRLGALETRLARIDMQAGAAEANTARAEALLVAFATRRSFERGVPLGYLGTQLQQRFSAADGDAVKTVLDVGKNPLTIDVLAAQLDDLAPRLTGGVGEEGSWAKFKREIGGLFVIRQGANSATSPDERLERAKLLLRAGRADAAADEVSHLPGSKAATDWIAAARRHAKVEAALDRIETIALSQPEKIAASPAATATTPALPGASPAPSASTSDSGEDSSGFF